MKTIMTLLFSVTATIIVAQTNCSIFEEQNGLLVIEYENTQLNEDWVVGNSMQNYTGTGYIYWSGNQFLNQTGHGNLEYSIKINTPGTYRFIHRMASGQGNNTSDFNDMWLKINAAEFYGIKSGGSTVEPAPQCSSNQAPNCPAGSTQNGFFKVYGHQSSLEWDGYTSDGDAHQIYVEFDTAGVYTVTINARSSWCFLDRMVLYKLL